MVRRSQEGKSHGIGVLVADSPFGPFKDPLGHPLVWQKEHWEDIDPSVFIDDDGQAYMYWGNPHARRISLSDVLAARMNFMWSRNSALMFGSL